MQPQNNVQNGIPVAPQPATAAPVKEEQKKGNLFENAPKKKGKGMLFGLIFCILLAAGGIAFGIWTMMDSNSQKEQLNAQISTLRGQVSELQEKLENATTIDDCVLVEDEDEENEEATRGWPVMGGVFGSSFYVIDNSDKIVAKDESTQVRSLDYCDIPVAEDMSKPSSMTCRVTVKDGDGVFYYDGNDGSLEFYYADEWDSKWQ